jgi:hypothetical protein
LTLHLKKKRSLPPSLSLAPSGCHDLRAIEIATSECEKLREINIGRAGRHTGKTKKEIDHEVYFINY